MRFRALTVGLFTAASLIACGGREEAAPAPAPADQTTPAPETVAAETAAETAPEPVAEVVSGSVVFEVDGRAKAFSRLPAGHNFYTALSSAIRAEASAGSDERLVITFLSIDLTKPAYPTDLPAPRDFSKPMDPMAAMATVGFSYTDEQGREWAGPGKIHVESYGKDGTLEATFTGVSIPHTDKKLPKITLNGGRVKAKIGSPW